MNYRYSFDSEHAIQHFHQEDKTILLPYVVVNVFLAATYFVLCYLKQIFSGFRTNLGSDNSN